MNKCLNCGANSKEKFCDELCRYGYSFKEYRKLDKRALDENDV